MNLDDHQVVNLIKQVAADLNLQLERRNHGASFCTVYLSTKEGAEQAVNLYAASASLRMAGVAHSLTCYDNPLKRTNGKLSLGHPCHGEPMIEIDSVWWGV